MSKGDLPGEVFTRDEARSLIDAARGESSLALRDTAMLVVLYRGGLRAQECCDLLPGDVTWSGEKEREIKVRHGKGNKARTVKIDPDAMKDLRLWRERRARLGYSDRVKLFCSLRKKAKHANRALDSSHLRRLVKRLAEEVGLEHRAHVHAFRHSYASELYEEGADIRDIQVLLGHAATYVTFAYLNHLNPHRALAFAGSRSGWRGASADA